MTKARIILNSLSESKDKSFSNLIKYLKDKYNFVENHGIYVHSSVAEKSRSLGKGSQLTEKYGGFHIDGDKFLYGHPVTDRRTDKYIPIKNDPVSTEKEIDAIISKYKNDIYY